MQILIRNAFVIGLLWALCACDEASIEIEPKQGAVGANNLEILIAGSGTNFNSQTTASFGNGSTIDPGIVSVINSESASIVVSIPVGEISDTYTLTLSTPGVGVFGGDEVVSADFEVLQQPSLTFSPTVADIGETGVVVVVDVVGVDSHFESTQFEVGVNIPDVTLISTTVVDENHALVVLEIGESAAAQLYSDAIEIHTDYQYFYSDFELMVPRGIEITPTEGIQGQYISSLTVVGHQTDFTSLSTDPVFDDSSIVVLSYQVHDALNMELEIYIEDFALPGYYFVNIDDGDPLVASFEVVDDNTPPVITLAPSFAEQFTSFEMVVQGNYTHFDDLQTIFEISPAGAGVNAVVTNINETNQTITLDVEVELDAALVPYTFSFSTYGEHVSAQFNVVDIDPQIVSITPSEIPRGEVAVVTVVGNDTHFAVSETAVDIEGGLTGIIISASGEAAQIEVSVPQDAPLDLQQVTLTTGPEVLTGTIRVLEGIGVLDLEPSTISTGYTTRVSVSGIFVNFESPTLDVMFSDACAGLVAGFGHYSLSEMWVDIDVPLLFTPQTCTLEFHDAALNGDVIAVPMSILSGFKGISVGGEYSGEYLSDPRYYKMTLTEGQIIKFRANQEPGSILDLVLTVTGESADFENPLASNDDESFGTWDSLMVFQAPQAGEYYLRINDRLGINSGNFTLRFYNYIDPDLYVEVEGSEPIAAGLVWGRFNAVDDVDCFEVSGDFAGRDLRFSVVAREISPYEVSGGKVVLNLYEGATIFDSLQMSLDNVDPDLFATGIDRVCVENGDPDNINTFYFLNITSALLINEVGHYEDDGNVGTFVEIFGEPNAGLNDCLLIGQSEDSEGTHLEFSIDLDRSDEEPLGVLYSLSPEGYLVIGHDTMVPGTSGIYVDPALSFSSGKDVVSIRLVCGGVDIDQVCWGDATNSTICSSAVASPSGEVLGRGFGIDTNDMEWDFLPQIEPSPWERNLTEVAQ